MNSKYEQAMDPTSGRDVGAENTGGIAPRPWAAALTIGIASILVVFIPLAVSTLNAVKVAGLPLGYYLAAQGSLLLVAMLGLWLAGPWRNTPLRERFSALLSSLTATGRLLSVGVLMTLVGTMFVNGYDGLPLIIGLAAGLLVSLVFVAPALDRAKALHADDLIGTLTGSTYAAAATSLAMVASLVMLLSIELEVAALAAASIDESSGVEPDVLIGAIATIAVAASLIPGRRFWYATIAVALIVCAGGIWLLASWLLRGEDLFFLPPLAYAPHFGELNGLERALLLEGLADPVSMPPFARPFVQISQLNFALLTLSVLLGAAVLPHMLWRRKAPSAVSKATSELPPSFPTRQKAALGLAVTALIVTSLPAVAVLAKVELYRSLSAGIEVSKLPAWAQTGSRAGYVRVCSGENTDSADQADGVEGAENAADCGDSNARMRIADLAINPAGVLLMAPGLAGLPQPTPTIVAALIVVLALIAAAATLRLTSEAATSWMPKLKAPQPGRPTLPSSSPSLNWPLRLLLSVVFAGVAAIAVAILAESPVNRLYWSFALLGASVFPMLLLAALIPRVSGFAVAAGGLAGLALCIYYMVGTTSIFAPQFAMSWSAVSDAPPWLLDELKESLAACATAGSASSGEPCANALQLGRELANWFGIDGRAAATIAAPVAFLVALAVWVLTPGFWRKTS